jgi:hypothetical protein
MRRVSRSSGGSFWKARTLRSATAKRVTRVNEDRRKRRKGHTGVDVNDGGTLFPYGRIPRFAQDWKISLPML